MSSPTGRHAGLNPAIAAPYTGRITSVEPVFDMDIAQLEAQFVALYGTMTERGLRIADTLRPGTYLLAAPGTPGYGDLRTASGNARQRRRQARIWRRQGFTVTHHLTTPERK